MSSAWPNSDFRLSALDALQSGLMVELIATPRMDLKTCRATDLVSEAVSANKDDQFDYLPVLSGASTNANMIVGMFHAAAYRAGDCDGPVERHMEVLSERHLIGSDTSIINFISDADSRPSRLVVSGEGFSGLVTLSDLQKLPVRAALFAAVTSFEMTMSQAIRHRFSGKTEWKELLNEKRRLKIQEEIEELKRADGLADELLFTQFCDKGTIVLKSFEFEQSKRTLEDKLGKFQKLRDGLAHANDYAATPEQAKQVCALVRDLLVLRKEIANAAPGALA